jgi:hypothetical protein
MAEFCEWWEKSGISHHETSYPQSVHNFDGIRVLEQEETFRVTRARRNRLGGLWSRPDFRSNG